MNSTSSEALPLLGRLAAPESQAAAKDVPDRFTSWEPGGGSMRRNTMEHAQRPTRAQYFNRDLESKIHASLVEYLGPSDYRPEIRDFITRLYLLDRRWRKPQPAGVSR
jgi:hypothetical protein